MPKWNYSAIPSSVTTSINDFIKYLTNKFMKAIKVEVFLSTLVGYCLISLFWNKWHVTGMDVVEMIFIGALGGLLLALTINPITRFIGNVVRKMKT